MMDYMYFYLKILQINLIPFLIKLFFIIICILAIELNYTNMTFLIQSNKSQQFESETISNV